MALAFAGIFVAGVLSMGHALNLKVPCRAGGGCDAVMNHPTSMDPIFGQPVAFFGFGAYLVLALLALVRAMQGSEMSGKAVGLGVLISGLGTLISFGYTYVAMFTIQATCDWCLASAAIMTLSFITHAAMANVEGGGAVRRKTDVALAGVLALATVAGLVLQGYNLAQQGTAGIRSANQAFLADKKIEYFTPEDVPFLGSKDAPLVVVEFGDLTCPHCRESYHKMKALVSTHPDKVKFVFRHFPLISPDHVNSGLAAIYVELANEKGQFWRALDVIYAVEKSEDINVNFLDNILKPMGITPEQIQERITNPQDPALQRVDRDRSLGARNRLNITSTPMFLIGLKGQKPTLAGLNYEAVLAQEPFRSAIVGK